MTDELEKARTEVEHALDASYKRSLGELEGRVINLESKPDVEFDLSPVNLRLDELNDVFNGRFEELNKKVQALDTKNETNIEPDEIEDVHEVETPVGSAGIQNTAEISQKPPQRKHMLFHRMFGK